MPEQWHEKLILHSRLTSRDAAFDIELRAIRRWFVMRIMQQFSVASYLKQNHFHVLTIIYHLFQLLKLKTFLWQAEKNFNCEINFHEVVDLGNGLIIIVDFFSVYSHPFHLNQLIPCLAAGSLDSWRYSPFKPLPQDFHHQPP